MADTQRTRAQLLALLADNVTGEISAQDLRDFVVTIMEAEFSNPGDFWKQPSPGNTTTDKTARGWIDYSQMVDSAVSFGNIVYLTASGTWALADCQQSARNGCLGLAMNSYAAAESQAQILRKGFVYNSVFSATFSNFIGRPLFLGSGVAGSVTVTKTTNSVVVIGVIEPTTIGVGGSGKFRFDPEGWGVKGV